MPVIGSLAGLFAPRVHLFLKRLSTRHENAATAAKQTEACAIALLSLQRSTHAAYRDMQSRFAALENQFAAEIESYRDRLEFVRLEILEQVQAGKAQNKTTAPYRILSEEKVEQARQAHDIRLNIGCGHKPLEQYLNVDRRPLPGVDIAASAQALPFDPESVARIHAAHLLEHFTKTELETSILPHWHTLLQRGGFLSAVVPDAEAMIAAYAKQEMNFSDLSSVTFGEQDYDDDFHYSMFSQGSLTSLLRRTGFKNIEFTASNRINGKCREMEVTAWK